MSDQVDLFAPPAPAEGEAEPPAPPVIPPKPPSGFDLKRHQLMALGAPAGSRYCFEHDAFEFGVAIYMVGPRAMFLCAPAAAALGGEKWNGWEDSAAKGDPIVRRRR